MSVDLFGNTLDEVVPAPYQSSVMGTDVWLTPPEILAALGPFDLDPCAPKQRPWDMAKVHYTREDNGLMKPWFGRVWLNPPYSTQSVKFMRRMTDHGIGTALVFARVETEWFFECVWDCPKVSGILFLEGRLCFCRPDGRPALNNAGAPSVLISYGAEDARRLRASGLNGFFIDLENRNDR